MSSRVLSNTNANQARAFHWTPAYGSAVNAQDTAEGTPREADPATGGESNAELEGALLRIQALEHRIRELEHDLTRQRAEGHTEGLAEGLRQGSEHAAAQWNPALDRAARAIGELATYRARFRREAEPELVRLSLGVARRILRRELSIDPHALLGVLKAALETVNQSEVLEVRLNGQDAASLAARIGELGLPAAVKVMEDSTLPRGELRIETKRGAVDAGIQTQLAEIENGFTDRSHSR